MISTATDYAINKKDTNAIVYCDAFGNITRITKDDFETDEDFCLWKELSDEDYHEIEKAEHLFRDYTVSLEGLAEGAISVDPAEVTIIAEIDEAARNNLRHLVVQGMETLLTEVQWIRLYLHYVDGMSEREIARQQGVHHKAIEKSINFAKIKIFEFLKK